ncbi:unnamed protein product, partial [Polarella glacialis]
MHPRKLLFEAAQLSSGNSVLSQLSGSMTGLKNTDARFVGTWRHEAGCFEVTRVGGELRWSQAQGSDVSRGILVGQGIFRSCKLSSGALLNVTLTSEGHLEFHEQSWAAQGITSSAALVAERARPHEVAARQNLTQQSQEAVRKAAFQWSETWQRAPADSPLSCLEACNCGPKDKRSKFLEMCLVACARFLCKAGRPLIYASFGSGGLWFDWWLLEKLAERGFHMESAHFIDLLYSPECVREASFKDSALGQLSAWLPTPSFAYAQLHEFLASDCGRQGAHLIVQCDADCAGLDITTALREGGLHLWLQAEGGDINAWVKQDGCMVDCARAE